MFEDSLFDSGAGRRPRKTWTKLASFALQMGAIGVLVLVPLIYTQAIPKQWTSVTELPSPPQGPAPQRRARVEARRARSSSEAVDSEFRVPSAIPPRVLMEPDEPANEGPPTMDGLVPGGIPNGVPNAVISSIIHSNPTAAMRPAVPAKLRVSSGVAEGLLVRQVKPQYPQLAVQARIQGTVVLQAVIGKDGTVQQLRLLSGHPMLATAAMEAVKQWRYRPYLLNGEPVDVDTQINVTFKLSGG